MTTMLCLIRIPNDTVLEVNVDCKAKGQECLDKVCQMLGIIEVDYFGLQFAGNHGELFWLNMRNSIRQQLAGPPSSFRLQLKVKFFVPPHLLLQESTRHQFYLSIIKDLQDGRLRVGDKMVGVQLTALIAQATLGDLTMSPNHLSSALLAYPKWLPMSLVDPHHLLGSPTTVRKGKRRKHHSGASDPDTFSEGEDSCGSTTAQQSSPSCDHEFATNNSSPNAHITCCLCSESEIRKLTNMVRQSHAILKGVQTKQAEYQFLQEIAKLEDAGVEYFYVRSIGSPEEATKIGLGPNGIFITSEESKQIKHSIAYSSIKAATHPGRSFHLTFVESTGERQSFGFKCENNQAATSIYRAVTEKHAFYSCETVRNAVTSQCYRDLKGTIVSLFDENTPLGKSYVFDIRRTCREVYDKTKRTLYQLEATAVEVVNSDGECVSSADNEHEMDYLWESTKSGELPEPLCGSPACRDLKEKMAIFHDSMLCRICLDAEVCTAFFPCRHCVCCVNCAPKCDKCPLCRADVENHQQIYLPIAMNG